MRMSPIMPLRHPEDFQKMLPPKAPFALEDILFAVTVQIQNKQRHTTHNRALNLTRETLVCVPRLIYIAKKQ